MNFNEKLIELRKKEGLSQEELGYKLNVTRQTVSKWELGQTTPEMDKLVEMSKIFRVSVDQLINASEIEPTQNTVIEDQTIGNEDSKNNKVVIIIIGLLAVILVWIIVKMVTGFSAGNKITGEQGFFDKFFSMFSNNFNEQQDNMEDAQGIISDVQNLMGNVLSKAEIEKFNSSFEIYAGTGMGSSVVSALDNIIVSNKKEERKITVKYMETETQNEEEIKNIKRNIESFDNYELFFEYDEDGFINKAIIEKL